MMHWHRKFTRFCVLVLTLFMVSGTAAADSKDPGDASSDLDEYYIPGAKWKEIVVKTPGFPEQDNLVRFSVDTAGSGFKYYIDSESLSVGKDNIVRYSIVIESGSGSQNAMYEGIRCDTQEYRTYAYGSSDKKFHDARESEWRYIDTGISGSMAYRGQLYRQYFCYNELTLKQHEILQRLQYGAGTSTSDPLSYW